VKFSGGLVHFGRASSPAARSASRTPSSPAARSPSRLGSHCRTARPAA